MIQLLKDSTSFETVDTRLLVLRMFGDDPQKWTLHSKKFRDVEELNKFLMTGVIIEKSITEVIDLKSSLIAKGSNSVEINSPIENLLVSGWIDELVVNNVKYSHKHNSGLHINLKNSIAYPAYSNSSPLTVLNYPIANSEISIEFLENLKKSILAWYSLNVEDGDLDISVNRWPLILSTDTNIVEYIRLLIAPKNPQSESEFSLSMEVINLPWRTFVEISYIEVPTAYRRKGFYSTILSNVKQFLDKHNLGSEIFVCDSSDNGETSNGASKHGLVLDPFMDRRYFEKSPLK
jgi:hypothetical protein